MQNRILQSVTLAIIGVILCLQSISAQIPGQPVKEKSVLPKSYPIHGSDLLWKQEQAIRKYIAEHPEALKPKTLRKTNGWGFTLESPKDWYADDLSSNGSSVRYKVASTCKAVGNNCYVFVENTSWGTKVTQAVVDSIRIYFDSKTPANPTKGIYQMDTEAFGDSLPDVDNDPKIIILLLDIRDGYDGSSGYVVGYFTIWNEMDPTDYLRSNFAEMFYIDVDPLDLSTTNGLVDGISTLAHEFQHMIHFNYDPFEISFINEGCSLVAEVHCGFPIYSPSRYAGETNHYLLDWRYGDMTNVLTDYSRAARFFVYIRDQVGIGVFKNIVASTQHEIAGIDAGLQAFGSSLRFNDILPAWFIANILDDTTIDRKYGYKYPNLPKVVGLTYMSPNVPLTADTVQRLAAQYISFKNGSQLRTTFITTSVEIKAVEIGPSSKRVLDVSPGTEFFEPEFGTTYKEVHFIAMNTEATIRYTYTYQSAGISNVVELKYDLSEPTGYYAGNEGDTVCVWFEAVPGGRLDSLRVALRRAGTMQGGVWRYTGNQLPTPLGTRLIVPISVTAYNTPVYTGDPQHPYEVPWNNWGSIDLRSNNIKTENAFAVAFINQGDPTTSPRVMVTESPKPAIITSFTYDRAPSGGDDPGWYYFTSNSTGDSVHTYLIRAYVSFESSEVNQSVELLPANYGLSQNFPNPFNPATTIRYDLPQSGYVTLKVYDMVGREVAALVNGFVEAGQNKEASFDGSNLPSGVYFYRLTVGNYTMTRKLVLLR